MQLANSKIILEKIKSLYVKMESNTLTASEIDEMVSLSRDLHERFVILRYKAFEQKVFGKKEEVTMVVSESMEPTKQSKKDLSQPTIDFSIFEESQEEIAPEESFVFEQMVEEEQSEANTEETEVAFEEEGNNEAPEDEPIAQTEIDVVIPEETTLQESAPSNTWHAYFEHSLKQSSTGLQTTLASLSGSFGLNERLLYINELFDGNSEAFSTAIQDMDKMDNWMDTIGYLSDLADDNDWDKESDTIGEFIMHVKRKHV